MLSIRLPKLILLVLCTFLLVSCAVAKSGTQPVQASAYPGLGLFSWQKENAADEPASEEMFKMMAQVGATEVYQNMDVKTAPSFLRRAKELSIDVYMLAGHPEWGLDPDARQMLKEVDRTAKLMAQMGVAGPAGLMLDVEPYLTNTYKKDAKGTMDKYLAAMRKTYAYAQEAGVPLIICIPYFYDRKGHIDVLNALIEEASDGVAVMNYQKKNESGQIETEMDSARRAGKRLIHIYELQRPGLYDLTERNTYSLDGLPAVWNSRDKLQAFFNYDGLSFALHDYTALREVLSRE